VSTICGYDGKSYHIVLQKGVGFVPEINDVEIPPEAIDAGCSVN
jgi:hypothetical protein